MTPFYIGKSLRQVALGIVLGSSPALALDISDFDLNRNQRIESSEFEAFGKHKQSEYYREADINKDGKVSPEEHAAYLSKVNERTEPDRIDFEADLDGRGGIPTSEARKKYPTDEKKPPLVRNLLIRRSFEDVGITQPAQDVARLEGAQFAFNRDIGNDNKVWQLRGAVIYNHQIDKDFLAYSDVFGLTGHSLIPSITFDRLSNDNDSSKDTDSLIFRAGYQAALAGGPYLDAQIFRTNLAYATDFNLASSVPALEFQWQPVKNRWGIGTSQPLIPGFLEYRIRPIFHFETGTVIDTGEKTNLKEGDFFLRVGPKFKLDFWPTVNVLDRLTFNLSWQYLWGVVGRPQNSDMFEAGASFRLDERGHVLLESTYRNGETPLLKENTETFLVGFSIKF